MDYYAEALKAGQKSYKDSLHRSLYPYLPVLDEMLPVDKLATGRHLGLMQIPVERIIGTKNAGRTHTFAANFMPLAPENSEFASKWKNLVNAHLSEGIRDPIRAYEYMNRYYVEEGNKRVSILKFFGAVQIPGEVIRILPERDGSEEVECYYEYVEFYQITRINFLEFTKPGSYRKFLRLIGRETKEGWDEEIVRKVRTDFHYFQTALLRWGGEKMGINAADAWLSCIGIYGYERLKDKTEEELVLLISHTWREFALAQEPGPIKVVEDPDEVPSPGLLSFILPKAKTVVKAAFLYSRSPEESNWVLSHEQGRLEAQERLDGILQSRYVICRNESETETALKELIEDGVTVIFATSAEMLNACLKMAIEYPKVNILNCSLNVSHKYIRMYYPRIYETRFISGAIAGAMSASGRIGYICNYPVYGNIAEINAFARGVQMTNAAGRVYLEWADDSMLLEKVNILHRRGIQLISVRDISQTKDQDHIMNGLQRILPDGTTETLVSPLWNWGIYYERMLKSILDGSFKEKEEKTNQSLNYFWGMSSDVAGIRFSDSLPASVRYMGELIRKAIRMGVCKPFYKPLPDESGKIKWHNVRSTLSMEEIIGMDWLEPNVTGRIPSYAQLNDKAKKLVDVMGVPSARKDPDELL